MKNNTKLIMETWRRFLKEGPNDDIESSYDDDYDQNQEENSIDEPLPGEADFDSNVPVSDPSMSDDYYGDPEHMGSQSPAPMLDAPDDDDMMDDSYDSYNSNDPTGDRYYDEFGRPEQPGGDTLDTTGIYDDSYDM